jgi:hypothetical protein
MGCPSVSFAQAFDIICSTRNRLYRSATLGCVYNRQHGYCICVIDTPDAKGTHLIPALYAKLMTGRRQSSFVDRATQTQTAQRYSSQLCHYRTGKAYTHQDYLRDSYGTAPCPSPPFVLVLTAPLMIPI